MAVEYLMMEPSQWKGEQSQRITLIMMAVAPVAYMFAEGWADSGEREKKNEK